MYTIEDIKNILLTSDTEEIFSALDNFNVNEQDKFGNNILHYYLTSLKNIDKKISFEDFIDNLINKGFNINQKQTLGAFKRSPLQLAVFLNLKDNFDLLISKKADIDSIDANGNTILSTAVMNYHKNKDNYGYYITTLLNLGANPNIKNAHGISASSLAKSISNSDVSKYFG